MQLQHESRGGSRRLSRTTFRIATADGSKLTLYRTSGSGRRQYPVLLIHGTFSNVRTCRLLSDHLARAGHDCWTVELRNHGNSDAVDGVDFETWSRYDVPAALSAVRKHTGAARVFGVGHSGGGLVLLMHLSRTPEAQAHVQGVVTLGSQATGAGSSLRGRAAILVSSAATNVLGRLPGRRFKLGPEDEAASVMNQWFRWNWSGQWLGRDGFDYLAAMSAVTTPTLCIAASGDRYIAPPSGCRSLFDALGCEDKQFLLACRTRGFSEDFSHSRIIASRQARAEIWPHLGAWMRDRS